MEKTFEMIEERLESNICELLKKPNMNLEDLKFLGESIDVLKDISIIEGMEDYSEEWEKGYSETPRMRKSMTRGRSPITGRYVSRTEPVNYTVDPHMHDHRSGHSVDDRIIAAMENMYDNAGSEHERMRIDEIINHIRTTGM